MNFIDWTDRLLSVGTRGRKRSCVCVCTKRVCVRLPYWSAKQSNWLSHARPAPFPFPVFLFPGRNALPSCMRVCIKSLFFQKKKGTDLLKISKNGSKSNKSSVFSAYFIFFQKKNFKKIKKK